MFDDIVDFLSGHYSTPRELEALLIRAFHDYPKIRTRLNLAGSPHDVATHVVDMLQRADEIKPGTQALWHLLITAREDFGYSVQKHIDGFRPYANRESSGSSALGNPPPDKPSSVSGPLPATGSGPLTSKKTDNFSEARREQDQREKFFDRRIAIIGVILTMIGLFLAILSFQPGAIGYQLLCRLEIVRTSPDFKCSTSQSDPNQAVQAPTPGNFSSSTSTPTQTYTSSHTPSRSTETHTPSATSVTLTLTDIPTLSPQQIALTPQISNSAWQALITERDFNGVTMVLVPRGCFTMGSTDGDSDERPVQLMCFEEPFWMDKYEVSNSQYGALGCEQSSSQPDQPHNCVTWFEARDFCATRDARLPTESEWEYAARGPDGLIYPWGNIWNENNLVWGGPFDFNGEIGVVGSRPTGASWVGAEDMSGNVWEWVSSLRQAYSPGMGQGREDKNNTGDRVIRGGRFNGTVDVLRAANRNWGAPDERDDATGFRCARDI